MQTFHCYLYLLRHGEITSQGVLAGCTDFALSEQGVQQLNQQVSQLPLIDAVYSSPLIRCAYFAEQVSQQHHVPLIIEQNLQEMDFGDWDGQSYSALWSEHSTSEKKSLTIGDFWQHPWRHTPPNGESMHTFTMRVCQWWQSFLAAQAKVKITEQTSKQTPKHILAITHAGVIKVLLTEILALSSQAHFLGDKIHLPYAGLVKIAIYFDEQGQAWPQLCF